MAKMNKQFKIVENFKWLGLVSLVIILAGIIVMCTAGLNIGIDFTGGAKVEIELEGSYVSEKATQDAFETEFKTVIEKYEGNHNEYEGGALSIADRMQISEHESGVTYEFRLNYAIAGKAVGAKDTEAQAGYMFLLNGDDDDAEVNGLRGELETKVQEYFKELGYEDVYTDGCVRVYLVGATASASLLRSAIWAIIAAIAVILVYIIIRFTMSSGIAAIIALAHDVLIMIAVTAMFQIPVNSTFIAAAITIIGYSINATIVVFDKIRECSKSAAFVGKSDEEIANYAIKHSMVKILLSTITTLIMVVALVIVSVSTIREFILPIIFGLIGGTYSSICLSPSVWTKLRKIGAKMKKGKKA